jgi:HEAT repeat protein
MGMTDDELEEALGDKNWVVRAAAAKALGNYQHKGVIPKLQELLQDDKEPVRFMAAASLVRLTRRTAKRAESQKKGQNRTQISASRSK